MGDVLPEYAMPNGHCKHLAADGDCAIYDTRPSVCRIDENRPKQWKVYQWHTVNAATCNDMQEQDRMDTKYRLKVTR